MEKRLEQVNEHTAATSILRTTRAFLGPTNPKKEKNMTLPMLETDNGSLCQTPEEAMQQWIQFFADMEGGTRQSTERLREDWITALSTDGPATVCSLSDLLAHACRPWSLRTARLPAGKPLALTAFRASSAMLPQLLVPEALLLPSLWKLVLFGHKALCYKGGLLFQAYKGKGQTTRCSSYRSAFDL